MRLARINSSHEEQPTVFACEVRQMLPLRTRILWITSLRSFTRIVGVRLLPLFSMFRKLSLKVSSPSGEDRCVFFLSHNSFQDVYVEFSATEERRYIYYK